MSKSVIFKIDAIEYKWVGGIGHILQSIEKGLKKGDTRVIRGELFYVYSIYSVSYMNKFLIQRTREHVNWAAYKKEVDVKWINSFKDKLFV